MNAFAMPKPAFDDRLELAFASMRAAHGKDLTPGWEVRAGRLRRLRSMVLAHRMEIAAAVSRDFSHRPQEETELLEVFPSLQAIDDALRHGRKWMKPRRRRTGLWFKPARSMLIPQPLGVVGIIVPWNYPLYLAVGPLSAALAAGNRAMLKLSEFTPEFAALFERLIARHFDPAEIKVINGDASVASAFSALPFDHLLFTGSTRIGREVMRTASQNLTPVTLELGGKSPAIIGPEADFENAVTCILRGKLFNAGQTCIAPDYVLLPEGSEERFIRTAREVFAKLYPAERQYRDYASIITERHRERLLSLVDEAKRMGAAAHPLADETAPKTGRQMMPVLVTGASEQAKLMQEEIFGPVLPLKTYRSIEEAMAYVNAHPHPLALYVFERNDKSIERVLAQTNAGGVTVNDTLLHIAQDELPFGGVGESGMGAYHGEHGFNTFTKLKPVVYQSRLNGMWLVQPPYGSRFRKMMSIMIR
ncbi:coniferyl aldehyde dehydrogenase [Noviherbaspirillum massiliense]|uniref:coniferyl aldehyde dehydrogenase n=1 Tax=Noviherbaspirillum massiliense TaxID=1465823 RepID=UPI00030A3A50|nr:coniferyl aldehyde dehydrogenase [Noviherbaspirillum massiliense]